MKLEIQSAAALEILPILIPTGRRNNENRRYLFDFREVIFVLRKYVLTFSYHSFYFLGLC